MKDLNDLIMKFDLKGQIDSIAPLGNGLINEVIKVFHIIMGSLNLHSQIR